MTAVLPDLDTIEHLDFAAVLPCAVSTCIDRDSPPPAVAMLSEHWSCCQRKRPICDQHRDLVITLRDIHLTLICAHHGTRLCAHRAFTLEPLP